MLIRLYLATVAFALVCFSLEFLRSVEVLKKANMECIVTIHTILYIIFCFIPIFNLHMAHKYYKLGVVIEDEELERLLIGEEDKE